MTEYASLIDINGVSAAFIQQMNYIMPAFYTQKFEEVQGENYATDKFTKKINIL